MGQRGEQRRGDDGHKLRSVKDRMKGRQLEPVSDRINVVGDVAESDVMVSVLGFTCG